MPSFLRAAVLAVLAAFLFAAPAQAQPRATQIWPHDRSDLKPDPGVTYGVLPNGLRYAIMRNTQPAGIASVRLRIGAGAMDETDATRGLAHFLEHMAFNGSQNVAEGELVKLLARNGLAFGPDVNAYTSFGETVYMLDLPKTDAQTVDTGLFIMRETAGRLTLAADAIDRERGVILSEERRRDSPEYRALKARFDFWLKGQPLVTRWPIGVPDTIRSVTAGDFRRFYEAHYRPEKALLVVVGDIDPAAIEAKIRARFSDWTQPGAAPAPPSYGAIARRGPTAAHRAEAGLPSSVTITWATPAVSETDTRAREARDIVRSLGYAVVNRRLQRIARAPDAPFISADVSRSDVEKSATLAMLDVSHRPGQWRTAMTAAEQELRRALRFGVTQAELDREIAEYAAAYAAAAESAATRDTRSLASAIPGAFDANEVFLHPADALAVYQEAARGLTAQRVTDELRRVFRGQGPLVFVSSEEPVEGGDAAILAAYRQSARTPVTRPVAQVEAAFAYADFGPPGAVAERQRNEEFGVDLIRFANGVRLTLKRTPFQEKKINVSVRVRGGLAYADAVAPGVPILASFVMNEAGLGKMTTEELERALAGRIVGADFTFGEDDFTWSGVTRPEDLALQMQVLAAFVTDPAYRPDGLTRIQQAAENFIKQYATAPDRVIDRDAGAIVRSGDRRWAFPTLEQVRALTIEDFRRVVAPMTTRPLEITVVGDFDPEAVIRAVAETFAALPARSDVEERVRAVQFPPGAPAPIQLAHEGRPDQAGAYIAWKAVDFSDARKARAARIARLVFDNRLTEEYRENLAATYSPQTDEDFSQSFPGFGYIAATVETPVGDVSTFFATVDKITAELREGRFDDDAIERARRPSIDGLKTAERGNGYWVAVLADAQTNPQRFPLMRTRITDMEAITKAEIVAAARATFDNAKAVRIVVTPKGK
ncbi:MAG: insulinase family protein [Hyphomonadaceae bacterium]|nr:insulinase family protein [Hyphomonadaceae bacterium]